MKHTMALCAGLLAVLCGSALAQNPPANAVRYATARVVIRDQASASASTVASLPKGTRLEIGRCAKGWCEVLGSQHGFVPARFLNPQALPSRQSLQPNPGVHRQAPVAGNAVGAALAPGVYKMHAIGGSGQNGTVTLTAVSKGKTQVDITLTKEPAGAIEPAHIHDGACRTPGPVHYPLTDVVRGTTSRTVVNAPISTFTAGTWSVNVHKSPTQLSVYVSCGIIK